MKEPPEVDFSRPHEEKVPYRDGSRDPNQAAEEADAGAVADGPEEDDGLDALAQHRDEDKEEQPPLAPRAHLRLLDVGRDPAFKLPGDALLPEHPEDHGRQEHGSHHHGHALEYLLSPAREFPGYADEQERGEHAEQHAGSDAVVHNPLVAVLAGAVEIAKHDAHHEAGLQGFP